MNEIKMKVEKFIGRYVNLEGLDENTDIFKLGVVNSLFAMQLVLFVEQEFSIIVDNNDISTDKFNNVSSITNYIWECM